MYMISDALVKKFEEDYLRTIAHLLRNGEIDKATAKTSAQELLKNLPFSSYDDMKSKIQKFTTTYPQLQNVYINLLRSIEEDKTSEVIEKMRNLMNTNRVHEAIEVAQQ